MKIVAYVRVSTQKQGHSGLGLQAQLTAIDSYAKECGGVVLATYREVESGKNDQRAQLAEAIRRAKVARGVLVIAKLDRLSRNCAFLFTLRDSGVKFVAADMPYANELTIGIMILVAQQEREAISKRTKEALAVKREQLARVGGRLGNPNGAKAFKGAQRRGNVASIASSRARADAFTEGLRPDIEALAKQGITSLGGIAQALTEQGAETPRGGTVWHKVAVSRVLTRLQLQA